MSPQIQKGDVPFPPTVLPESAGGAPLRYMRRRRVATQDRNGDPLDGLVNLWVIALVLAVAFLLAALTGLGLWGVITGDDLIAVTNPGDPGMRVITKNGTVIKSFGPVSAGDAASDSGSLLGEFYRLADGTIIYVPAGEAAPGGVTAPVATPTPGVYPTPTPTPTVVYPTPTPTPFQTSPYTPATPGSATPDTPGKKGPG